MINILKLSISIAIMEGEIVDIYICETKSGCEIVIFQYIFRHGFEFPEAWVATSRLDDHLLAWCGW